MKLIKNFISLAGAEAFSKLVTFAAFAYLARALGANTFGYLEFAGAVLMCASLIVDQGFSPYGAREIARSPEQTGRLVTDIVTARFLLAASGYLLIVLFALKLNQGAVMFRLILIYGLSIWVMPLLLQWVFQGHDRMHLVAIAQMIRQSIFALIVFLFVRGPEQILMVAWAEVAGVTGAAIFCVAIYRRLFRASFGVRPTVSARLFREGVPIGMSQMFWVVRMFGGTLILGVIASGQTVGLFAGAQRILVALHAFIWLYYFNLLPSMSRMWQRFDKSFDRLIERSLHGVAWASLGAGLVWILGGRAAMRIVYGPEFAVAGSALAVLAVVGVLAFINGHYRFGLIAAGHQTTEMLISALGTVVALVSIPLGYNRFGLVGAAMGLALSEGVIWLASWECARRLLDLTGHSRLLLRPFIAFALALCTWWLPLSSTAARVSLALLIFITLLLTFDHTVRESLLGLLKLRRTWSEQQSVTDELAKAAGGVEA